MSRRHFTLLLATGNQGKVREFKRILEELHPDFSWRILQSKEVDLGDIEETGETFMENAMEKAIYAWENTGILSIGEDSGLEVQALSGLPGVHSHRFSASGLDEDNNALLLEKLSDLPQELRSARYVSAIAVAYGGEIVLKAKGCLKGLITEEPQGQNGFGYDPIFYCQELEKTLGQARPEEKDRVSHRRKAISQIVDRLISILSQAEEGAGS